MARQCTAASSQYLDNATAVSSTLPLTFACWGWPDTNHAGVLMGITLDSSGGDRFEIGFRNTGGGIIRCTHSSGGTNGNADTSATTTIGGWNHVVGVFTSGSSRTAYLNGGNSVNNTTAVSTVSGNRTTLGRRAVSTPTAFLNGRVAEAAIWNVALDAAEIAALNARARPTLIRPTALLAYWPCIGRYSPEIDLHANFDLTITGATAADHPAMIYTIPAQFLAHLTAAAPTDNPVPKRRIFLPEPTVDYSW